MQANTIRSIYALIHTGPAMAQADLAPLEAASELAKRCQGIANAVLVGADPDTAVERARALGMENVWVISNPAWPQPLQTQQLTDVFAAALASGNSLPCTPDTVFLLAAGAVGEEIAGRLAARLNGVPLGKIKQFEFDASGHMSATRTAFGGRLNTTLNCQAGPFFAAVRKPDNAMAAKPIDAGSTAVHHVLHSEPLRPAYPVTPMERSEQHAALEGARLVVAGGRGMGSEAGFTALYDLAAKLGGAVGGSLPTIDAGWAPVARQVGQSGKYVSPEIYVAIGISGTPQHMAGIDPHTKVIAINKDPEAGIFQAAHIGVVADWQEFLPALVSAWEALRPAQSNGA
ncbi:electron transfer flavoprotein subunit alpha/FixB family protein [Candidimonas sp. SYP-B2681]|uniref:electron transfer flavoprotein subunit alpha/FixB family protein n=1 Tax=Candidimonas sp. SYP-B2681 TaxID=2497686 RepID=UPI000F88434E|nr:electron transfer flavoprotein subunit alpha/FixB family protein [Candidimonas sp. SYP-B2681]RTZ41648.1 electron transfer flavoprotein subunit alpha/FixB family protein [Candidimonas sp. SYP-B2681]